jgi:hypothetical protein
MNSHAGKEVEIILANQNLLCDRHKKHKHWLRTMSGAFQGKLYEILSRWANRYTCTILYLFFIVHLTTAATSKVESSSVLVEQRTIRDTTNEHGYPQHTCYYIKP